MSWSSIIVRTEIICNLSDIRILIVHDFNWNHLKTLGKMLIESNNESTIDDIITANGDSTSTTDLIKPTVANRSKQQTK